jgi:predicted peptidase
LPKLRLGRRALADGPFPFLVVAPQCPSERTWCDEDVLEALDILLTDIVGAGQADPAGLAVAGFSMGGYGAYCAALRRPERFAALVSVCGCCLEPERLSELAHLPQWIAWADDDEITRLTEGSRDIVRRLSPSLSAEGRLVARAYQLGASGGEGAHVRTADAAFSEKALYQWLSTTLP